jgi:hypothetical protein
MWNAETKKAMRVDKAAETFVPDDEQKMLVKFAESYGLKHRFGVQADNSFSDFYGVTGIPHVVVIDQQGKVGGPPDESRQRRRQRQSHRRLARKTTW